MKSILPYKAVKLIFMRLMQRLIPEGRRSLFHQVGEIHYHMLFYSDFMDRDILKKSPDNYTKDQLAHTNVVFRGEDRLDSFKK